MSRSRLVLVGGGHAHVHVVRSLAMRPAPEIELTLVSPHSQATYTGMVPGVLAGQYRLGEAQIDLRALAARARAVFVADRAVKIDPGHRSLELAGRPALTYDLLSLDVGSRPAGSEHLSDLARIIRVKPIELAATGIEAALAAPVPAGGHRVVVVGAGAGGTEIAFALASRLGRSGTITVCDRADDPVTERGAPTAHAVRRAFERTGITFEGGVATERVDRDGVHLANGRLLPATLVVWAAGAAGPTLFAGSRLPLDERGFLLVGDDLRCGEFPEIFAAGDCATLASHRGLAKAGVYAVRQGPVLERNLRAAARGGRLRAFRPQKRFLSLLNTGDGRAILSYGRIAARGRWAWRLKDRIDRAFVAKYARPPLDPSRAMAGSASGMVPCGGCAAKLGADALRRVLERLEPPVSDARAAGLAESVIVGLDQAEDAAVFAQPPGTLAVATADVFPPFDDDLYLVGRVAAVNAASDLYAMGAEGSAAIAVVCLPRDDVAREEERLELFLRGALRALGELDIPLAGGHTIAGEQTLVGFAMHGWVRPERILKKASARPGDRLVLTKPLGTGVVLAAARAGVAAAEWVEAAHASMLKSNRAAMRLFAEHGVRACTDVTGFGLAGHLSDILRASRAGARLAAASIPSLPGARELLAAGWRSSFHADNERAQTPGGRSETGPDLAALMVDPQTSGGLLAAVPAASLDALLAAGAAAGEALHVVGEVIDGPARWELA